MEQEKDVFRSTFFSGEPLSEEQVIIKIGKTKKRQETGRLSSHPRTDGRKSSNLPSNIDLAWDRDRHVWISTTQEDNQECCINQMALVLLLGLLDEDRRRYGKMQPCPSTPGRQENVPVSALPLQRILQQLRLRYRLEAVGGRLQSAVCMSRAACQLHSCGWVVLLILV